MAGLAFVSLLTAAGMLAIFKYSSDQRSLEAVKRQIHACLFEMRLFNDDLRAIVRAQLELLRHNLTYLRLSLVPMVFLIPPLVFVVAQLQFHYGYTGLVTGQATLVEVDLARPWDFAGGSERPALELEVPDGLRVDSPGVWIPVLGQMAWRIVPERPGHYTLGVRVEGETYSKSVCVSPQVERRSPRRVQAGFVNELIYPAEPPLPRGARVSQIRIVYPSAEVSFLGLELHWLVWFFVLSILFAFALRRPLGVTI